MAGADDTATLKMLVEIREGLQQLGAFDKKVTETFGAAGTEARKAGAGVDSLDDAFNKVKRTAQLVAGSFLAIKAANFLRESVEAAGEAEDAYARVQASIEATGGAAHKTAEELAATATAIQQTTTVGDEEVLGLQNTLLGFTHIIGQTFDRATLDIVDLSAKTRRGVEEVALAVGKALDAPKEGLAGLARIGVRFSEEQQKVIERLVETGRTAEAQGIILAELEKRAKGAAEALNDTLGGALKNLKDDWGEVQEAFGAGFGGAVVSDAGKLSDSLKNIRPFAEDAGRGLGTLLDWAGKLLRFWPALSGAAALASEGVLRAVASIAAAIQGLLEGIGLLSKVPGFGALGGAANDAAAGVGKAREAIQGLADDLDVVAQERYKEFVAASQQAAVAAEEPGKKGTAALDTIPPAAAKAGKALADDLGGGAKKATLDLEDLRKAALAAVEAQGGGISGSKPSDVAGLAAQKKGLEETVSGLKAQQDQGTATAEQLAQLTAAQDELATVGQKLHNATLDVTRAVEGQGIAWQTSERLLTSGAQRMKDAAEVAQRFAQAGLEIPSAVGDAATSIGEFAEQTRAAREQMGPAADELRNVGYEAEVAGQQWLAAAAGSKGLDEQSMRTAVAIEGLKDRQFEAAGTAGDLAKAVGKTNEELATLKDKNPAAYMAEWAKESEKVKQLQKDINVELTTSKTILGEIVALLHSAEAAAA